MISMLTMTTRLLRSTLDSMATPSTMLRELITVCDELNCPPSKSLTAITQRLQVGDDGSIELRGFCLLLAQRRCKALHLLFEGLAVVLGGGGADVAARREHVAVL